MSTLVAQTISNGTVSTSSANVIQGSAKAWVTYNAITPAILASYNVSSVTFVGTGNFTVNFTNAFSDTNYAVVGSTGGTSPSNNRTNTIQTDFNSSRSTSAVNLLSYSYQNQANSNPNFVMISVFR